MSAKVKRYILIILAVLFVAAITIGGLILYKQDQQRTKTRLQQSLKRCLEKSDDAYYRYIGHNNPNKVDLTEMQKQLQATGQFSGPEIPQYVLDDADKYQNNLYDECYRAYNAGIER